MTSAFSRLRDFLDRQMRMSHIYQPVMLELLLRRGGTADIRDIAAAILAHDESQIDYYEEIVKKMPGRVLTAHGIVQRQNGAYRLHEDVETVLRWGSRLTEVTLAITDHAVDLPATQLYRS